MPNIVNIMLFLVQNSLNLKDLNIDIYKFYICHTNVLITNNIALKIHRLLIGIINYTIHYRKIKLFSYANHYKSNILQYNYLILDRDEFIFN